jgi:sortase A
MSELDTMISATDLSEFEPTPDSHADAVEPGPSTRVRILRRLAVVVLAFSVGSVVYGAILAPLVHARRAAMLEEQLASSLINGTAPVSNPIALGTPLALVEIPDHDVRAVVAEGTKAAQLALSAGHLVGSALPGQPGVAAILGRSRDHGAEFANLDRVRVGDGITVTTGQGVHTYEVIDTTVRTSRDMAAFQGEGHMLILATVVDRDDRLVVRATLTSPVFPAGDSIVHQTTTNELGLVGDSSSWTALARWLVLGALVALVFPALVRLTGRRVAWMLVSPVAMWIAVEAWSALSLTGPAAL